ncbi:MAG: hypothetical protein R2725_05755 [Solirubrobacterales bacterium]
MATDGGQLRDAYRPNRRVRLSSDVATLCAVAILIGLLGTALTWWERSALFDLASNSLEVVKLGTGYLVGPLAILVALPLVFGRARQVALKRWYKERIVIASLLWLAGIVVLVVKVSGLDGYSLEAGTYVTGALLAIGLVSTLLMWPAGLAEAKVDRAGLVREDRNPRPSGNLS